VVEMMRKKAISENDRVSATTRLRITVFQALLTITMACEMFTIVRLQLILPEKAKSGDLGKNLRRESIVAKRGAIYARDMTPLAITSIRYYVCADPTLVREREKTALMLSSILEEPYEDILKRLSMTRANGKPVRFQWVKRDVDAQVAEGLLRLIRQGKLKGIFIGREAKRTYPCGKLASQLLGFVNRDGSVKEGIELKWDKVLSGKDGVKLVEVNAKGEPIVGGEVEVVEPVDGKSLVLTIDPAMQSDVEELLERAVKDLEAKAATAVVMELKTGEILAAASIPSFDPNMYNKADPQCYQNRVTTFVYEPGSAFKVIVAAIGLDSNVISESSKAYCGGKLKVGNSTINCWVGAGHGMQTLPDAIKNSCNVVMAQFAMRIPKKTLWRYLLKFGFAKPTGCGVIESSGWIDPPEVWDKARHANLGFGYGIAVTPLQVLNAVATIARGGLLLKPKLIKAIIDEKGQRHSLEHEEGEYVISPATAAKVRKMMELVVLEGTGKKALASGYRCAGKTGTTRKMIEGKGYGQDVICSFVGFFPADSPTVAAIIVIDEPKRNKWASQTAAPLFSELVKTVALHMSIPPTNPPFTTLVNIGARGEERWMQ
jgi:stage V sporulation protein D (sporulation-specific penicillin-binding protein)